MKNTENWATEYANNYESFHIQYSKSKIIVSGSLFRQQNVRECPI